MSAAQTSESISKDIIRLTQKLLDAIAQGDYTTYSQLCDSSLTAFEPEAPGVLVEDLLFHKFYFDHGDSAGASSTNKGELFHSICHLCLGDDGSDAVCLRVCPLSCELRNQKVHHSVPAHPADGQLSQCMCHHNIRQSVADIQWPHQEFQLQPIYRNACVGTQRHHGGLEARAFSSHGPEQALINRGNNERHAQREVIIISS